MGVLSLLVAAGCRQTQAPGGEGLEGTAITFSMKVDESERPALQELLSRFQQRTRARVNLEQLSRFRDPLGPKVSLVTDLTTHALVERLKQDVAAGEPSVHLFAQDNVALSPLVEGHLVQALDGLVPVPEEAIDELAPASGATGSRYFLPFHPNVRLAYARAADLERAGVARPESDEDLLHAARVLKGTGRPRMTMSLAAGDPATVTVCELIVSRGGNPLVLNDPGSVEAFTLVQRLWQEGLLAPESFQAKWDTEVTNLAGGTASMAENWSFTSAQLARTGQLTDFVVYRGWAGPRQVRVIGGDVLGIPAGVKGKQLQAAVALATFLMSRESQELLARRNAWPSFREDVDYRSLPADQQATFAAIGQTVKHGWYRPAVSYWPQVSEQINNALVSIVLEGKPAQPVLDELHGRLDAAATGQGTSYP